jgi:hypothetical protein
MAKRHKSAVGVSWVAFCTFATAIFLVGCPHQLTGYLVSVTAHIQPQTVEPLRNAMLATDHFQGPVEIRGPSLCADQEYFRNTLQKTRVSVLVFDCYRASRFSETGWEYSVTISGTPEAREEMEALAQVIRGALEKIVPKAKIVTKTLETGYGFSLIPY